MSAPALVGLERRAPPLAAVGEGYLVGKRRPLSSLPAPKQEQIRKAYDDTQWASDHCLDLLGFFTDHATALNEAAKHEGGFVMKLPVNAPLSGELVRLQQSHPNSPAATWYEETNPGAEVLSRSDRDNLDLAAQRLEDICELAGVT